MTPEGISLRDYLAGIVLLGKMVGFPDSTAKADAQTLAAQCYERADALIAAQARTPATPKVP